MFENEFWKAVRNYEGLYEVSNWARVKSLNYNKTGIEGILKPRTDIDGYLYVCLYKNGKRLTKKVSRLVAEAFIPNPENKPVVDHINKVVDDNRVENLQWITYSGNNKKSYDQGRAASAQVVSTWFNEKLNQEFTGNSCELARAFPEQKLDSGTLRNVRLGKRRKQHKGWTIKS